MIVIVMRTSGTGQSKGLANLIEIGIMKLVLRIFLQRSMVIIMILFKGDGAPHHLLPGFSNLSSCTNTSFPNARAQHYHTALKHMIVDNFTLPQHTVPLIMLIHHTATDCTVNH